ncbi:MAG: amidase [Spirochaetaceae bacterium]|nr:MAG: amidase [Spirochaetaceae bacterium]
MAQMMVVCAMSTYDLESLSLPVLKGAALRGFAAALENRVTRGMLIGSLLDSGGITRLRALAVDRSPLFYPIERTQAEAPGNRARRRGDGPSARELRSCVQTPNTDSIHASVGDYVRAYTDGSTTPTEVATRFLAAIDAEAREPKSINAFIAVDRERLLRDAAEATERYRSRRTLGPLDGVPVAVKDEVDMLPYPTTVGTSFLGASPAAADATAVARLRAAGALLLGKANMHEIGINPTGHNVHHGHARNPYDRDHDPGGSSSGPAAATAAGLCPVSLGADGGGSIRVPAAHCGLVGLKPTFGRVSLRGSAPIVWSVGHLGPIGAHTSDVALAYATIAGPDDADPNTLRQPPVSIDGWDSADLGGVRLGVFAPWFRHADPEIVSACESVLAGLVERGATIVQIEIPELDALRIAHAVTILSEMASAMSAYPHARRLLAPATRISLALARSFTSDDYLRAQRVRARAMERFTELYASVDAIVTPTSAVPAPAIPSDGIRSGISDLSTVTEIMRFAVPANMLGLPAISFPAGYTAAGLPIGMQAMAAHWQEHLLLRIANVAERFVDRRPPEVHYRLLG